MFLHELDEYILPLISSSSSRLTIVERADGILRAVQLSELFDLGHDHRLRLSVEAVRFRFPIEISVSSASVTQLSGKVLSEWIVVNSLSQYQWESAAILSDL